MTCSINQTDCVHIDNSGLLSHGVDVQDGQVQTGSVETARAVGDDGVFSLDKDTSVSVQAGPVSPFHTGSSHWSGYQGGNVCLSPS